MNSYRTIEEARTVAANHPKAKDLRGIIEIVPGVEGIEKYIVVTCEERTMRLALRDKPMKEIKSVVGMVVDFWAERAAAHKATLALMVPGLEELRAAYNDVERYHEEFGRMMEDEQNDGVNPPKRIKTDPKEVAAKYPVAAAYIKAEYFECASNFEKSSAGRKAKERIEKGENHETVIAEMEAEWDAAAMKHIWD